MRGLLVTLLVVCSCLTACVDVPASVDPASEIILICGEKPRPTATPSITYLIQGGVWMIMMPQADLEAVMVDQDRLSSWGRCATEAIVLGAR